MRFFIKGSPAPFATKGEAIWKEALRQSIPSYNDSQSLHGVILTFHLKSFTHNKQPFDIDNLVEPVFSVLVGEKGYFRGRRPNIKWWYARKVKDTQEGLYLELSAERHYQTPLRPAIDSNKQFNLALKIARMTSSGYDVLVETTYMGDLPKSAKSIELPEWLKSKGLTPLVQEDKVSVYIGFSKEINIADISTGQVKSVIDCLYPVLGGTAGNPEDWKIEEILVEKNFKI